MTNLEIRRIPFAFDDSVPFQWHPTNPEFGMQANAIGIIAIAFEKYIVSVVREAQPLLEEPKLVEEADAFLRQEALHARSHRLHMKALVARHPGLQRTIDDTIQAYDRLREQRELRFHLAYIADLEATFTPLFKMMLDNRHELFTPGDDRVASLFTWHFVEEIEHRSSALTLYHALVPSKWYRLRVAPQVAAHILGIYSTIMRGFGEHVPLEDRLVDTRDAMPGRLWLRETAARMPLLHRRLHSTSVPPYARIPNRALLAMVVGVLRSQLPSHDPTHEALPEWAGTWIDAYRQGADMTRFEGTASAA